MKVDSIEKVQLPDLILSWPVGFSATNILKNTKTVTA